MKTSTVYPIRFWALLLSGLLIYQFSTEAEADWCKYEKEIDLTLDLASSEVLAIAAAAGDLDIIGVAGSDKAVIHGKVCASKEAWMEESGIGLLSGNRAEINVNLPDTDSGWSWFSFNYVWLDLRIEVPQEMTLDVKDSSGDITMKNIANVQLKDSSGDIDIENARGTVTIHDSSGDIEIDQVAGDLIIEADSSGDIYASDITGSVLIKQDSSGDIRIKRVSENVVVELDSSGDIRVSDIGGDFRVLKDGSGSIWSNNVSGEVQLPQKL